jgi:hypothetical protein
MISGDGVMRLAAAPAPGGLLVAIGAAAMLAVGCGSGSATKPKPAAVPAKPIQGLTPSQSGGTQYVPAPSPTGKAASPGAVAVIQGWSDALRRGDVHAAGAYFALPSVMINGADSQGDALVLTLRTRAQADAASATLPCGAKLISTDQRGRYTNALFRLSGRPGPGGSTCGSGAGLTARTNFVIAHGKILEWIRAPDDPGDNASPGQQPATPKGSAPGQQSTTPNTVPAV